MTITIRLFALLRDLARVGEISLELAEGARVGDAVHVLVAKFPALEQAVQRIAYAVNFEKVDATTKLRDGDEVALLPPVSGG